MIDKMVDKVKAHYIWRLIIVVVLAEIIGAFYLFLYLLSILAK